VERERRARAAASAIPRDAKFPDGRRGKKCRGVHCRVAAWGFAPRSTPVRHPLLSVVLGSCEGQLMPHENSGSLYGEWHFRQRDKDKARAKRTRAPPSIPPPRVPRSATTRRTGMGGPRARAHARRCVEPPRKELRRAGKDGRGGTASGANRRVSDCRARAHGRGDLERMRDPTLHPNSQSGGRGGEKLSRP
jgi:hypothetical protein